MSCVVGSINIDLVARVDRFPRAGETVLGCDLRRFPGGKGANQAVAAARLGAPTTMISAVGDDAFGAEMRAFLATMNVERGAVVTRTDTPTGTALITVCAGENSIVVVPGANACVTPESVTAIDLRAGDVLLCQLEVPIPTVNAAIARANARGARAILNAAPALTAADAACQACDILLVNEVELGVFADALIDADAPIQAIFALATRLLVKDDQAIIVTLGRRGAVALSRHGWIHEPGRNVDVIDTTGAGDCFCGALAASLARGAGMQAAVKFANAAASICAQRAGAGPAMPTLSEVEALL
ncbi:MAG: ribokinase [Betaproteobacteria bacterium]|nr:ribokinase [Betaproteobacteria bacterium]